MLVLNVDLPIDIDCQYTDLFFGVVPSVAVLTLILSIEVRVKLQWMARQ